MYQIQRSLTKWFKQNQRAQIKFFQSFYFYCPEPSLSGSTYSEADLYKQKSFCDIS